MNEQDHKEASRTQAETQASAAAHEIGIKSQAQQISNRKQNPQFYEKYTKTDLQDSEKWGHLANEHAVWIADDHILSNRRQVFRRQREILNRIRAELSVVGATPGVRLREKPLLNAIAQGVHPELEEFVPFSASGQASITIRDEGYTEPMTSEERTVMDDFASLATARQAMGVEKAGSEALTTATTESRTVREDETEKSGVRGSISGVFD